LVSGIFALPVATASVVKIVAVKAPKSHKDQQGSGGAQYTIQSKAVIFDQFQ
jgi:hypothetical protein